MRKADIAEEIFKQVGISKNEASDIVEFVLNLLKSVLQKGESVKIAGFGNFVVRSKGARKGRNPRTGEEIGITPDASSRFDQARCSRSTSIRKAASPTSSTAP